MIIVSACLAGINCRYDGKSTPADRIRQLVAEGKAIPVCPEQLGGANTPRPVAEIEGGAGAEVLDGKCKVITKDGTDVTGWFVGGAEEVLKLAQLCGADKAILKSQSPSCGCRIIYDGSFSGKKKQGNGVTAELLVRNGIKVVTEEEI